MDVYDTLLTQAEIQGNISQVNDVIRRKKAEEACKLPSLSFTLELRNILEVFKGLKRNLSVLVVPNNTSKTGI